MKLNNKGFAISSIMYIILILAVILISVTLAILSSRKLILDKIKKEASDNIYGISYNSVINTLKHEAVSYASNNNIEQENIKIGDFETSVSQELLEHHELLDKYLTLYKNNYSYDVYLGQTKKITDISKPIDNMLGIVDYKIEGNSYQATRSGKNLFDATKIKNTNIKIENNGQKITLPLDTSSNGNISTSSTLSELCPKLNVGDEVILNFEMNTATNNHIYLLEVKDLWYLGASRTITQEMLDSTVFLYGNRYIDGDKVQKIITNFQIEKGTTATEYEEYGVSPSPEYPGEIKSVGDYNNDIEKYQIPVKVNGMNLFDLNSVIISGGILSGNKIISNSTTTNIDLYLKKGSYSIKFNNEDIENVFLREGQVSKEFFKQVTGAETSTFIFEEDEYLRISYFTGGKISDIMLVEGSYTNETMPNYEPYIEPVTTNIYLDEPLRKIGNYVDSMDFSNTQVVRAIKKVDLSTLIFSKVTGENGNIFTAKVEDIKLGTTPAGVDVCLISSYANGYGIESGYYIKNNQFICGSTYFGDNRISILDNDYDSEDAFKDSVSGVQFDYALQKSIPSSVNLPKIKTDIGSSMIEIDTSVLPSNVEFTIIEKIRKL